MPYTRHYPFNIAPIASRKKAKIKQKAPSMPTDSEGEIAQNSTKTQFSSKTHSLLP